jgi:hypothetical protein
VTSASTASLCRSMSVAALMLASVLAHGAEPTAPPNRLKVAVVQMGPVQHDCRQSRPDRGADSRSGGTRRAVTSTEVGKCALRFQRQSISPTQLNDFENVAPVAPTDAANPPAITTPDGYTDARREWRSRGLSRRQALTDLSAAPAETVSTV